MWVNYDGEITAKKSCMYAAYGLFEQLLVLLVCLFVFVCCCFMLSLFSVVK